MEDHSQNGRSLSGEKKGKEIFINMRYTVHEIQTVALCVCIGLSRCFQVSGDGWAMWIWYSNKVKPFLWSVAAASEGDCRGAQKRKIAGIIVSGSLMSICGAAVRISIFVRRGPATLLLCKICHWVFLETPGWRTAIGTLGQSTHGPSLECFSCFCCCCGCFLQTKQAGVWRCRSGVGRWAQKRQWWR